MPIFAYIFFLKGITEAATCIIQLIKYDYRVEHINTTNCVEKHISRACIIE